MPAVFGTRQRPLLASVTFKDLHARFCGTAASNRDCPVAVLPGSIRRISALYKSASILERNTPEIILCDSRLMEEPTSISTTSATTSLSSHGPTTISLLGYGRGSSLATRASASSCALLERRILLRW